MNRYLDVAPEVQEAIKAGKPVVALESTIISHGMPYPQNVETALNVEKIIREGGAVPATIAYNMFLGKLDSIETRLINFAGIFLNRVQREVNVHRSRGGDR